MQSKNIVALQCVCVLVGYNKWREFCGLETARTFERMTDITDRAVRRKFRRLYRQVAFCCCQQSHCLSTCQSTSHSV